MTTRDRIGAGDPERRGDLLFMGLFALIAGGVIVVDIFSTLHDRARFGQPVVWWEPTVWEVSSGLVLEVRDGARRVFVPVADILWVEAAGNYVELHTRGGTVLHRASLVQIERRLAGFVRIHRSRLVSRAAVAQVETKSSGDFNLRLTSGQTLAGSRRFRAALRSSAA